MVTHQEFTFIIPTTNPKTLCKGEHACTIAPSPRNTCSNTYSNTMWGGPASERARQHLYKRVEVRVAQELGKLGGVGLILLQRPSYRVQVFGFRV